MKIQINDSKSREITEIIMPYIVPIFILPSEQSKANEVTGNGSAILVNTGEKKLIITCSHVWNAFLDQKKDNPNVVIVMGMGNKSKSIIINDFQCIDNYSAIDIAVIEFLDSNSIECSDKMFYSPSIWPPIRPQIDDVIVLVGWPNIMKTTTDNNQNLIFRTATIVDFIVSISDRHIVLGGTKREVELYQKNLTIDGHLGGISGCPAFVNRNNEFEFIGIVYEAGEGVHSTIFISHAEYIKHNGEIDRQIIPFIE